MNKIVNLSRHNKKLLMLFVDSVLLVLILLASFSIRLDYWYVPENDVIWVVLGAPIIAVPIFVRFGLYRAIIRYIGFKALWAIVQAVTLYALLWGVIGFMAEIEGIPRSVILINWLLGILVIGGSRMIGRRFLLVQNRKNTSECNNVVVYGAGSAGRQLSIALTQSSEYNPVAFIDDNSELHRQSINGIEVVSKDNLERLIKKKNVTEVLLSIPTLSRSRRNKIILFLEPYSVLVRSLPSVSELAQGKAKIADLREVSAKDLLGRDSVVANKELLGLNITNKVVMVTGAGGSIGAELCRQILFLKPKVLILFEQNEFSLYSIDKELSHVAIPSVEILPMLGSVNNRQRLSHIMQRFDVQTIYHTAAYKHVPMVEFNNAEGVSNNIFGTLNCAQVAIDNKVETFVLISTDKAVRPTNTMGATKRFAEMILQALTLSLSQTKRNSQDGAEKDSAGQYSTRFSMVRFGNVLDSSGSVIPLFKEQIKEGGPITVTDAEVLRYFMSIPEAVELVIQAGAMAKGGDVFVLDMGEPVRIVDLAKKMIRLSGLEVKDKFHPDGDIEIEFTGLRPGEKLYEELLIGGNTSETDNPKIMRAEEEMLAWDDLKLIIDELERSIDSCDQDKLRQLLIEAVPGFKPQSEITDVLYDV
jgi:FlaA1/EpsC-like NDP-sugar epimerase